MKEQSRSTHVEKFGDKEGKLEKQVVISVTTPFSLFSVSSFPSSTPTELPMVEVKSRVFYRWVPIETCCKIRKLLGETERLHDGRWLWIRLLKTRDIAI